MPLLSRALTAPRARHARPAAAATVARAVTSLAVAVLTTLTVATLPTLAHAAPETRSPGSAIEGLSPYQGQTSCDPVAKPGVVKFRDLVLAAYPGTGDSGIVRACHVGGTSEHKEGRAWDWRVNTNRPSDVADVDDLMTWLLATDAHGNVAAMARRLGVMYMIWDSQVWKSYQAGRGWQPYTGASPHTDHVHVSFSWAGASGETSYWTGRVAPVMPAPSPSPTATPTASPTATPSYLPGAGSTAPGSPQPTATATPAPTATATPTATPTATATPAPTATSAPARDSQIQVDPRTATARLVPGPWKRH